jgi:hypothetical protein
LAGVTIDDRRHHCRFLLFGRKGVARRRKHSSGPPGLDIPDVRRQDAQRRDQDPLRRLLPEALTSGFEPVSGITF